MGRVYRNEAVDATHLAMFHQLEGIWIDEGLTFADLKGILAFISKALYGDHPIRFKPKFYPYTEPSVGVTCNVQPVMAKDVQHVTVQDGSPFWVLGWYTPKYLKPLVLTQRLCLESLLDWELHVWLPNA